jgi:hypothetical protein
VRNVDRRDICWTVVVGKDSKVADKVLHDGSEHGSRQAPTGYGLGRWRFRGVEQVERRKFSPGRHWQYTDLVAAKDGWASVAGQRTCFAERNI